MISIIFFENRQWNLISIVRFCHMQRTEILCRTKQYWPRSDSFFFFFFIFSRLLGFLFPFIYSFILELSNIFQEICEIIIKKRMVGIVWFYSRGTLTSFKRLPIMWGGCTDWSCPHHLWNCQGIYRNRFTNEVLKIYIKNHFGPLTLYGLCCILTIKFTKWR